MNTTMKNSLFARKTKIWMMPIASVCAG
jgi:hypothetical protein